MTDLLTIGIAAIALMVSASTYVREWLRFRYKLTVYAQRHLSLWDDDDEVKDWVVVRIANPSSRPNSVVNFGLIGADGKRLEVGVPPDLFAPILPGHISTFQIDGEEWKLFLALLGGEVAGFFVVDLGTKVHDGTLDDPLQEDGPRTEAKPND